MHTFNLETTWVPALAAGVEVLLPVGALAARPASIVVKGVATRSTRAGRLHVNAAVGTYATQPASVLAGCGGGAGSSCSADTIPILYDPPCRVARDAPVRPLCRVVATSNAAGSAAAITAGSATTRAARAVAAQTAMRSGGNRWLLGVAADRAFPFRSLLVIADVYVEHFDGLAKPYSWTAEAGARRQLGPRLVVDAGLGRRYVGPNQLWFITAGATRSFAPRLLMGRGGAP
jgi:hypothetical protein